MNPADITHIGQAQGAHIDMMWMVTYGRLSKYQSPILHSNEFIISHDND